MSLEIVELLTRLNDGGTTVIMVTHAHELVRQFDRRVVILENGRVVYDGNSKDSTDVLQSSQGHLDRAYIDSFDPTFAIKEQNPAALDESIKKYGNSKQLDAPGDFTVYLDKSADSEN